MHVAARGSAMAAQILIVSADRDRRTELLTAWSDSSVLVAVTPLEVIRHLELENSPISLLVLSDLVGSATCGELEAFLEERYPHVRVIGTGATARSSDGSVRPPPRARESCP